MPAPLRSRDGGSYLWMWERPEVLVVCPRCRERAQVLLDGPRSCGQADAARFSCLACGLQRRSLTRTEARGAVDPRSGLDLWSSAPFREHVVWAYNAGHARRLREFVAATHRERGSVVCSGDRVETMSMVERLPRWMTSAKNRQPLLVLLDELLDRAAVRPSGAGGEGARRPRR